MHRNFEEVGVTIGSVPYGHFTGEAQFDENGQVVQLISKTKGSAVRL